MTERHSIAAAIKNFTRRAELDPGLAPYERVVYKAALVEQGANIDRLVHDATADALVMIRAVANGKACP
jgi:hypothetical protein